jgi:transmembrane sensor
VIFDNTPLSQAVDELNRYSSTHIGLADPELADLRLSGTFATGGTSAFVEAIAAYFPIQIEHTDSRTVTLKGRPRP